MSKKLFNKRVNKKHVNQINNYVDYGSRFGGLGFWCLILGVFSVLFILFVIFISASK